MAINIPRRTLITAGLAFTTGVALDRPAFANGDGFFGLEALGPIDFLYYGTVRDKDGKYLTDAEVTLTISEPALIFVEATDILGHFRMPDVGKYLIEAKQVVDPSKFHLSAKMDGYTQVRKLDRKPARVNKGAFEVNFVMAKNK